MYNLIVAMSRNNGIGCKGKIPWHNKQDLKYFSEMTKGDGNNAVIMGRNTWESLPRTLTNRDNLVLSKTMKSNDTGPNEVGSNSNEVGSGPRIFKNFELLETFLDTNNLYEDIWIIGGAQVYKQFLNSGKINKCYVTLIDHDFPCDTFFPVLDLTQWKEIERNHSFDFTYNCAVDFIVYERT